MLYVCDDVTGYKQFVESFQKLHPNTEYIDLSKVQSSSLAEEAISIVEHHKSCYVFLGYLEPGWMLDASSQVKLRRLFRKFSVGIVSQFSESLPFSWKNEIHTIYTFKSANKNGGPYSVHDGSIVHNQLEV